MRSSSVRMAAVFSRPPSRRAIRRGPVRHAREQGGEQNRHQKGADHPEEHEGDQHDQQQQKGPAEVRRHHRWMADSMAGRGPRRRPSAVPGPQLRCDLGGLGIRERGREASQSRHDLGRLEIRLNASNVDEARRREPSVLVVDERDPPGALLDRFAAGSARRARGRRPFDRVDPRQPPVGDAKPGFALQHRAIVDRVGGGRERLQQRLRPLERRTGEVVPAGHLAVVLRVRIRQTFAKALLIARYLRATSPAHRATG